MPKNQTEPEIERIGVDEAQFMVERVKQAYSALLSQTVTELAALQLEMVKLQQENAALKNELIEIATTK